jgi:hypothetical protein
MLPCGIAAIVLHISTIIPARPHTLHLVRTVSPPNWDMDPLHHLLMFLHPVLPVVTTRRFISD